MIRNSALWRASLACIGAMTVGLAMPAQAQDDAELKAEVAQLRAEVAQMRADQGETWLNDRRAEEVKSLIRDVLEDADTRASLIGSGPVAGHDGKFFIASADGNYRLNIGAEFQARYILNINGGDPDNTGPDGKFTSDSGPVVTNDGQGFQMRRLKLKFSGHAIDPKLTFKYVLQLDRDGELSAFTDSAWIAYDFSDFVDGVKVTVGNQKLPFLRQELIPATKQLGLERASVTEFFTLYKQIGVNFEYKNDFIDLDFQVGNGANTSISDFNGDKVGSSGTGFDADYALTLRADWNVFQKKWKYRKDQTGWKGDSRSLFLGGAVHWQEGGSETDDNFKVGDEYLGWTLDGLYKSGPLTVMGAYMQGLIHEDEKSDTTPYGFLAEAGYMVIPDTFQPYARYEFFDDNLSGHDSFNLLTGGFNWYFKKRNLRFTADAVWVVTGEAGAPKLLKPFGDDPFSDGLGFSDGEGGGGTSGDGHVVLRTQIQLLF